MKKFDVVLMNPPYYRDLHLKFLEKTLEIADNVISVQPVGYLLDLPAVMGWKKQHFQKYEHTVSRHIRDIDIMYAEDANEAFSIRSFDKIGIYNCDNGVYDFYKTLYAYDGKKKLSIFNKVIKRVKDGEISNIADHINISVIHGHPGKRDEFDIITPQMHIANKFKPEYMSEEEFARWHESCGTKFMKYCNMLTRSGAHLNPKWLPYMDDYKEPWTDERFYDFFNLTDDEIDHIENTMRKYIY